MSTPFPYLSVAFGLIDEYVERSENNDEMRRSQHVVVSRELLTGARSIRKSMTLGQLMTIADQCQKALFDFHDVWAGDQLRREIETKQGWPAGTIHRFVFSTPQTIAA